MLANIKISVRLIVGFVLVAAFSAVVGGVGISNMNKINDMADAMYANDLMGISYIKEANIDLIYVGRDRANYLLAPTPEERHQYLASMKKNMGLVTENIGKAKPLFASAKAKELFETFARYWDDYQRDIQQVVTLAEKEKLNQESAEMSQARKQVRDVANRIDDLMTDLTKIKEARAKEKSDDTTALYQSSRDMMFGAIAGALALGVVLGVLLSRSVTVPLNKARDAAQRLAEGDLTVHIDSSAKDETGQMLRSMQNMIGKLSQVVAEVNGASAALASASEEVSATAQSLSQSASEQAAGVEETSASIEQMTASIAQNTENAKVTDGMASKAAQEAAEGGEAVKETVSAMNQIAKKIGIIDDIAYQTNLLALNAAIEAARAGEHGKGFAVVAAEVRKLAERSQVAAQEIGEVATNSVALAEKAGKLLDEMVPSIKKTSDLVQEITAASEEQSSGVGQINAAVGQLSQTTQQNASSSEELAATAEEMSGQAELLQQLMSFFKLERGQAASVVASGKKKAGSLKQHASKKIGSQVLASIEAPDEVNFTRF